METRPEPEPLTEPEPEPEPITEPEPEPESETEPEPEPKPVTEPEPELVQSHRFLRALCWGPLGPCGALQVGRLTQRPLVTPAWALVESITHCHVSAELHPIMPCKLTLTRWLKTRSESRQMFPRLQRQHFHRRLFTSHHLQQLHGCRLLHQLTSNMVGRGQEPQTGAQQSSWFGIN